VTPQPQPQFDNPTHPPLAAGEEWCTYQYWRPGLLDGKGVNSWWQTPRNFRTTGEALAHAGARGRGAVVVRRSIEEVSHG